MRRATVLILGLALALGALALPASASSDAAADPAYVFAGGGTLFTNGVFFPGTTVCDDTGCTVAGGPVQVARGTDFTFVDVDAEAVANAHQIVSLKRNKKTKRPLFVSDLLTTPGDQDLVVTSHLKPGIYTYRCSVHFGMFGQIEITP